MNLRQSKSDFKNSHIGGFVPVGEFSGDRPSIEALTSAYNAINALGPISRRMIPPSVLVQFGDWLNWPAWLKNGTMLDDGPAFPERITVAEDLVILANIVDHGHAVSLVSKLTTGVRIAGAHVVAPALYNAPTLRDAFLLAKRSTEATTPYVQLPISENEARFSLKLHCDIGHGGLREFVSVAILCSFHRFIAFFLPDVDEAVTFTLPMRIDSQLADFLQNYPGKMHFDATDYAIEGDCEWLDTSNRHADLAFWNFALERVSQFERSLDQADIVERIRTAIRSAMEVEGRVPRLKQMAASEHISERTLVRMLSANGTSFHKIVGEERRFKASELIGNTSLSLAEIAKLLGFSDMSSFGRSFRQWYGMTPGQARLWRIDDV